jgi:hypothetical protein
VPKPKFLNVREIVRSAVETQHESADILLLVRNSRARARGSLGAGRELVQPAHPTDDARSRYELREIRRSGSKNTLATWTRCKPQAAQSLMRSATSIP